MYTLSDVRTQVPDHRSHQSRGQCDEKTDGYLYMGEMSLTTPFFYWISHLLITGMDLGDTDADEVLITKDSKARSAFQQRSLATLHPGDKKGLEWSAMVDDQRDCTSIALAAGGKPTKGRSNKNRPEDLLNDATSRVICAQNERDLQFLDLERQKVAILDKLAESKKQIKKELNVIKKDDEFGIPLRYADLTDLKNQLQKYLQCQDDCAGIVLSFGNIKTELLYPEQLTDDDIKKDQLTVSTFNSTKTGKVYILLSK